MVWKAVCVDLENTAYVTGGVPFVMTDIGMKSIHDMYVYGSVDPFNQADVRATAPDGVNFWLDKTDPTAPKLVYRDSGGEVTATTTYAGDAIWLLVGGTV